MKTVLFTNFSTESFTGYWDGKPKKFEPGQSVYMQDYLANHFAKHLVNRELLKLGFERSTSPKRPEDVPEFMELFNKAVTPEADDEMEPTGDPVDVEIDIANKNREEKPKERPKKASPTQPQVIISPDFGDDDEDEESFGGKPVDTKKEK